MTREGERLEVGRFGTTRDLDRNKKVFHLPQDYTPPKGRAGRAHLPKDLPKADEGNFPVKRDLPVEVQDAAR